MALLKNPNFEWGGSGWGPINFATNVSFNVYSWWQPGTARTSNSNVGNVLVSRSGGSVGQDFWVQGQQSVAALAWVRAAPGEPDVHGVLALWELAGILHNTALGFVATQEWTLLMVTTYVTPYRSTTPFRIEFYLNTIGSTLLLDSVNAW